MRMKGIVTGVIRDSKTGKFKRTFTVENDVTDWFLGTLTTVPRSQYNYPKYGPNIFISDSTAINNERGRYVSKVLALGVVESGVTSPTLVVPPTDTGSPLLDTPPYIQFQQRFPPPATDRNITTIGITSSSIAYARVVAEAWVTLNPVCGQTTTETLDIFYRVQFLYGYDLTVLADQNIPKNNTSRSKLSASIAAYTLGTATTNTLYYFGMSAAWQGGQNFNNRQIAYTYTRNAHDSNIVGYTDTVNQDLCKTNLNLNIDIANYVGKLIGTLQYGAGGVAPAATEFRSVIDLDAGDDPIQTIFGHSADATLPFYDSTKTQSGVGKLSVAGTGWTNPDWPKMYRVDIITGGATGTASYKLKIRNHFGFYLNSYREQERSLNLMGPLQGDILYEGFDINREDIAFLTYNHPTKKWLGLAINPDEICVVDISKQTGVRTHVSNRPNFTPTKIGIVYHDETLDVLWVPCRETGLYKIEDPSGARTVTKMGFPVGTGSPIAPLDRCLTVTKTYSTINVTANSRLWAIFSDATGDPSANNDIWLWFSDDDGITWNREDSWDPITKVSFQPLYFNEIGYIAGDINHAEMRLLILYNTRPSTDLILQYAGMWHDINGTVDGPNVNVVGYYHRGRRALGQVIYYGEDPRTYGHMITASPQSTRWGGSFTFNTSTYIGYFDYGLRTTINAINTGMVTNWITAANGDDVLMIIDGFAVGEYHSDNTRVTEVFQDHAINFSTASGSTSWSQLYLGKGIFVGKSFAQTRAVNHPVLPDRYNENVISSISPIYTPLGHSNPALNVWTNYAWDGSSWVEDPLDVGAGKPTHTAPAELFDGVTIAFNDDPVNPGAGNWIATDYYTFGVCDGIWLDGSTEIAHTTALYFKAASENTAIENTTLPSALKVVDIEPPIPLITFMNNTTMIQNGNFSAYSGVFLLNSFDKHYQSTEVIENPVVAVSASPRTDVIAGMTFKFYTNTSVSSQRQFVLGFSSATRIGNAPNYEPVGVTPREESPEFAFRFDPPTNGLGYMVNISVVHSGVVKATIINYNYYLNAIYNDPFRIEIKRDGHIVYTVNHPSTGEEIIYDSSADGSPATPPIATFENYHVDWVSSGGSNASYSDLFVYGLATANNYLTFGDVVVNSGYWNPAFYAIDYERGLSVQINSIEGTRVADNLTGDNYSGTITPLAAGEYSLFPKDGVIRYAAADATLPIAVSYTELLND